MDKKIHPIALLLIKGLDVQFYIDPRDGYVIGKQFAFLCESCKELNKPDNDIDEFVANCDCQCEIFDSDLLIMQNYHKYPLLFECTMEETYDTVFDKVSLNSFKEQHETDADKIKEFTERKQLDETRKGVTPLANAVAYKAIKRLYKKN